MTHHRCLASLAIALSLWPMRAQADPIILRMATVAPQGSAWAREALGLESDLEAQTRGSVKIKWYFGGVAGDETQVHQRIKRDQLDGIFGVTLCTKLAPSMRVLRIIGMFQDRAESAYVSSLLKPVFDAEFVRAGYVNLGEIGVGPSVIFSRTPVGSLADLRAMRTWVWDLDEVFALQLPAMGIPIVATPIETAGRAFEHHEVTAMLAVPTAALAFQWSAEARHYTDLRAGFVRGCFLVSSRAFDQLSLSGQRAMRAAAAKVLVRLDDVGRAQDEALLGGLFSRQGLEQVVVTDGFRASFFEAARTARENLGDRLVPRALLQRVLSLLADFRAEHPRLER